MPVITTVPEAGLTELLWNGMVSGLYLKIPIFWIKLKVNRRFKGTCLLHLHGRRISQIRNQYEACSKSVHAHSLTLKMQSTWTPDTSVGSQRSTLNYIPEGRTITTVARTSNPKVYICCNSCNLHRNCTQLECFIVRRPHFLLDVYVIFSRSSFAYSPFAIKLTFHSTLHNPCSWYACSVLRWYTNHWRSRDSLAGIVTGYGPTTGI
jgi:hypothetical protein